MPLPSVHIIHRPPTSQAGETKPPLLFIHGGYVSADCWDIHFLPYFAARGYDCHAIDLPGHGQSAGRECLDSFGLDDYVQAVRQASTAMATEGGKNPIIIGHSMGAAIAEELILDTPVEAAILLSPVPTIGTIGAILRLASRYPQFFLEMSRLSTMDISEENLLLLRNIYFSPQMPANDLLAFSHLIQEESQRAISELTLLAMRWHARRPRLPVLVMGGEQDLLFPPSLLPFITRRWHAEQEVIPHAGHVIMLDVHWQRAAEKMHQWLRQLDY